MNLHQMCRFERSAWVGFGNRVVCRPGCLSQNVVFSKSFVLFMILLLMRALQLAAIVMLVLGAIIAMILAVDDLI